MQSGRPHSTAFWYLFVLVTRQFCFRPVPLKGRVHIYRDANGVGEFLELLPGSIFGEQPFRRSVLSAHWIDSCWVLVLVQAGRRTDPCCCWWSCALRRTMHCGNYDHGCFGGHVHLTKIFVRATIPKKFCWLWGYLVVLWLRQAAFADRIYGNPRIAQKIRHSPALQRAVLCLDLQSLLDLGTLTNITAEYIQGSLVGRDFGV